MFTHVGNDVYTIRSAQNTDYYLGIAGNSTANNVNVVLRTGTVTNGMKWRIVAGEEGYKIVSYLSSARVLKTNGTATDIGSNLLSGAYTADTDYRDEWELHDITNHAYIEYLSRVYYDTACNKTQQELTEIYQTAAAGFMTNFHIRFNLTNVAQSSALELSSECSASYQNGSCNSVCAPLTDCNTLHHRSAKRLIELLESDFYYTYRLVGYGICYYDDSGHDEDLIGLGNVNGNNALTSLTRTSNLEVSIQHELTHNLGGSHKTCVVGQRCILKGNLDEWCDACAAAIRDNYS